MRFGSQFRAGVNFVQNQLSQPPNGNSSMLGLLGGLASAAGGIFSSIQSSKNAKRQIAAQQQENALNRQFNSDEAQKTRDFQLQMFNKENEYNDPSAVMARMRKAGVNPALAYGGFADSASFGSAPSASSSGGISPVGVDYSGIQSAGRAVLDAMAVKAQTRLTNAQAEKTEAETPWVDRLNSSLDDLQKAGVDLKISAKDLNEKNGQLVLESINEVRQVVDNLKTAGEISKEQLKQAFSETHIKEIQSKYADLLQSSEIRKLMTAADVDEATVIRSAALLAYDIANVQARTTESYANASLSRSQKDETDVRKNLLDYDYGVKNAMHGLEGYVGLGNREIKKMDAFLEQLVRSIDQRDRELDIEVYKAAISSLRNLFSIGAAANGLRGVLRK